MDDYLGREGAPFSQDLWNSIDAAVVNVAKEHLTARRFLPLYGPLGPGANTVRVDAVNKEEVVEEGVAYMTNRQVEQLPQLFEDFWLYWRDLEETEQLGRPADISAARTAAGRLVLREDRSVFYGIDAIRAPGLLTAKGVNTQKRGDWAQGENAYLDVAAARATLLQKGRLGSHTLVVSEDLYVQLQRIQEGTGVLEAKRIGKLLDGRLYHTAALQPKTAILLAAESQYVDLALGQDISVAYLEAVDLNHHLRILETALPRIKDPSAIVVFK